MTKDIVSDQPHLRRHRLVPAMMVIVLCLIGTGATAFLAMKEVADRESALFNRILDGLSLGAVQSVESYEQVLLGLSGFVAGSEQVTEQEWVNYVSAIQNQDTLPAVRDFGLVDVKSGDGTTAYSRFITLVTGDTVQASGRDLLADETIGPAAMRAIETGQTSLSQVVRNRFGAGQTTGYALIAPVVRQEQPEAVNESLVFLSFAAEDMLAAVLRNTAFPICLELYDGSEPAPDTLVTSYCRDDARLEDRYYEEATTISVGGRTLTFCLTAKEGFYVAPLALPAGIVIPLGLIITVLLGSILWFETTTREQARRLAQVMTTDLETSRNRYDRVVRVAGVGFWEHDHLSDRMIWSEQMWALAGLKPGTSLSGDSIHMIEMLAHPDDRGRVLRALSAHISRDADFSEEFRILRPDDTTIWIYATADTDRDEQGNPIRTTGSATDITPRKNEEERRLAQENELKNTITELRESQARLDTALRDAEAASRAKSTFLSTMSHELRTPLNAILGFSEVIRDNLLGRESTKSYQDYAGDIHSSGQHLLDLINDILDLAKVEEGQIALSLGEVLLNPVIESTLNLMQPRAIAKRQALSAKLPETQTTVYADLRALKQILFNLISNAIQFTDIGGKIEIGVNTDVAGSVEICVTDTGIGIAPEDTDRIFNPFERVTEPGKPDTEGTGLGLAVVKSLVELHHGSLRVDSEPGKGSTFCIALPTSPPAQSPTAHPPT